MMETTISNFHTSFYIQGIQKLAFHIPHVQILGTNHRGDSRQTVFKRRKSFKDVLCLCDYAESVLSSLHIKYNQNTTVEIDKCLLRVLHYYILVYYHTQK